MSTDREQHHHGDAFKPIRWLLLALLFLAIIVGMD
tara:strand:+ start:2271 stop:2375 length:105 start_codon:yes stop_codon:yes gene_type:complete